MTHFRSSTSAHLRWEVRFLFRLLAKLLEGSAGGIVYSEHLEGDGADVFAAACGMGLEGIVSKRRDRPYTSGPCKHWVKVKNPNAPAVLRFQD
jgi:ATP-dependent DNA ligase